MTRDTIRRTLEGAQAAAVLFLVALLALTAFTSLRWRMEHDAPLLHYAAFLMDRYDRVPYRDFLDLNFPGTLAFHYGVVRLFGYSDRAFRFVDLSLLAVTMGACWAFMRRFGRLPALWGPLLFGLEYLRHGQTMSLQRDYLGIAPILLALLAVPAETGRPAGLARFGFAGLMFGVSALFKPHLAMGLAAVFGALLALRWADRHRGWADMTRCLAVCAAGFVAPIAVALAWLAAHGALRPFVNLLLDYVPLYTAMTGRHEALSPSSRALYLLISTAEVGSYGALLLCAMAACYLLAENAVQLTRATAVSAVCLALCVAIYTVYPALAGKFWDYHYMPLACFASLASALCLFAWPGMAGPLGKPAWKAAFPLLLLCAAVTIQLRAPRYAAESYYALRAKPSAYAPKRGRVDEIAGWLKARLRPGDSAQPLDWTGGAVHAMLLSEAKLATRFMYDYHFYHHASTPEVRRLRAAFMGEMRREKPRFVIEVAVAKPWPKGVDATRSFPELQAFLDESYTPACRGDGYVIHERADRRFDAAGR